MGPWYYVTDSSAQIQSVNAIQVLINSCLLLHPKRSTLKFFPHLVIYIAIYKFRTLSEKSEKKSSITHL